MRVSLTQVWSSFVKLIAAFLLEEKSSRMSKWCSTCLIIEHCLPLTKLRCKDVRIITNFSRESKTTEHSLLLNAGLASILKSTKDNESRELG